MMSTSSIFNAASLLSPTAWLSSWMEQHPFWGWIVAGTLVLFSVAGWFIRTLPAVDIFRARILKPFVKRQSFKRLVRAAKKYDIRGNVNAAVLELRSELPVGWIREMDIEWVEQENKEDFFHDGEVVVRVRPYEEQSRNFATVTYQFLAKSLFPRVKKSFQLRNEKQRFSTFLGDSPKERVRTFTTPSLIMFLNQLWTGREALLSITKGIPIWIRTDFSLDFFLGRFST